MKTPKTQKPVDAADQALYIEVINPKEKREKTAICAICKNKGDRYFSVSIDFVGTGYRLNDLGQQFFLEGVGREASKKSKKKYFDCIIPGHGRCFSFLQFKDREHALRAFTVTLSIPSVELFLMDGEGSSKKQDSALAAKMFEQIESNLGAGHSIITTPEVLEFCGYEIEKS